MRVKALVLAGNGTNCERETAHALRCAGADQVEIATVWEFLHGVRTLDPYNLLCLPGGFADGDHLGSARARAHRFTYAQLRGGGETIRAQLHTLWNRGGLIVGICNGFQLLVALGLLPLPGAPQRVTLTHNLSGRFEDRWVALRVDPDSPCVFTRGLSLLELPVRHGEGRVALDSPATGEFILNNHLAPLQYCDPSTGLPTTTYPFNPNGSPWGVAALCDPSGRILGIMPHPEAFTHRTNHPHWTRRELPQEGLGVQLFRGGVRYLQAN